MDPSGGGGGGNPYPVAMDPSGVGEDHLSALPVDVLVLILLRLDTAAAGRTSVLSHHWRRLWALFPELRFPADADLRLVASALAAHEEAISYLHVRALDAAPESVEACLALAAGRLSGQLVFQNRVSPGGNAAAGGDDGDTGGFDLTCLHNATAVSLNLGLRGCLAVPTTGVFARLTELSLENDIGNFQYALEDLTRLPCLTTLSLLVVHDGHAFGASLFHVLRICSDLRMLTLSFDDQVPDPCPSGCVCDQQPSDWKTEELTSNCLKAVDIDMDGSDHQVAFVKRLFTWAVMLETVCIYFDCSMSECKVVELRQMLSSFAGPETCVEFYMSE